jgi:hypothetical protein
VSWRILDSKGEELIGSWKDFMRSYTICTLNKKIIRVLKSRRIRWVGRVHGEHKSTQNFGQKT